MLSITLSTVNQTKKSEGTMSDFFEWLSWIAASLIIIYVFELWWRNRGLPPGPWGLPYFGFYPFLRKDAPQHLSEIAKQEGSDIISFRTIGGSLFVVLSDLSLVKEVLISRADEFIGRPITFNYLMYIDDGYGLLNLEGEQWREQRKFFLSTVKNFGFGKTDLEPLMHDLIRGMLKDFRSLTNKSFDLAIHISTISGNIIGQVLFRGRFKKEDPEFQKTVKHNSTMAIFFTDNRIFLVGSFMEKIYLNLVPFGRRIKKAKTTLMKTATAVVKNYIRSFDPHHLTGYVDSYLNYRKNLEEQGQLKEGTFSLAHLESILMSMLLEGTETISSTLVAMLCNLAGHQAEQKQAQAEIDDVVGGERLPSWSDKTKMPYIDALILELFRTSQVFNISTYYSNFEETSLKGYRIPKRSFINVNLWALNNDPKTFPNPSKFDPSRFLGERGQRIKQEGPFPFGLGKRSCVGESLAQMEVFVITACILQSFTLHPDAEYAKKSNLRCINGVANVPALKKP